MKEKPSIAQLLLPQLNDILHTDQVPRTVFIAQLYTGTGYDNIYNITMCPLYLCVTHRDTLNNTLNF